ncbi:MAG: hypothetical protein CM1200mP30_20550 [Pseudomonadota bacterium]|nr:MAG: hypothetical protein CM1200mP30_20550 [Pseudomonadota bacterium]
MWSSACEESSSSKTRIVFNFPNRSIPPKLLDPISRSFRNAYFYGNQSYVFCGTDQAYVVIKGGLKSGRPGAAKVPVVATHLIKFTLPVVLLWLIHVLFQKKRTCLGGLARNFYFIGALFFIFQGYEWIHFLNSDLLYLLALWWLVLSAYWGTWIPCDGALAILIYDGIEKTQEIP